MSIYEAWSVDDAESERALEEVQIKRAANILRCRSHGHQFGPWRADLNNKLFRVCCRCSEIDKEKWYKF